MRGRMGDGSALQRPVHAGRQQQVAGAEDGALRRRLGGAGRQRLHQ
jgi:hypothetical protein